MGTSMEFETGLIEVGHTASKWGPFAFDFEDGLPSGVTISSASVKSYLGRVTKTDKLSDETETTSELINSSALASSYVVNVFFDLPTTSTYLGDSHTVVFELTLSNAGTHSAYFYRVKVVREA